MEVPSEVLSHLYSRYVKFLESATKKLTSAHTRSATLNLQQRRRLQEKLNACARLLGQLEKDLASEQKLVRLYFVLRTSIFRCINHLSFGSFGLGRGSFCASRTIHYVQSGAWPPHRAHSKQTHLRGLPLTTARPPRHTRLREWRTGDQLLLYTSNFWITRQYIC